jgi:hypothetical protein
VYLISTQGARQVFPVSRGCLLLGGIWSCHWCFQGSVETWFSLNYSMHLIWTLCLTANFSVYLARLTDFDCGLFRLPNLDTQNLTTDISIWNGAHGRCDR